MTRRILPLALLAHPLIMAAAQKSETTHVITLHDPEPVPTMPKRVFVGKYDPQKRPFPQKTIARGLDAGPVGNSRPQRRARARLSFEEQRDLARSVGFVVFEGAVEPVDQAEWIEKWEAQYKERT